MKDLDPGIGDVPAIGRLKAARKERAFSAWCDAFCYDESTILYCSVIAPATLAKGFGAALNGKQTVRFEPTDLEFRGGVAGTDRPAYAGGPFWASEYRYRRAFHRLGYDWVHAAWAAKDPTFLPSIDPESLWRALRRPEWTTPLLRDWLPEVTRELIRTGKLKFPWGHGCRCGKLVARPDDLDEIVSRGVRDGRLVIPAAAGTRREAV